MKQKIREWFTHNLLLKIVALVFAVLLWLSFSVAEDPVKTESFSIPIAVEHLEEFRSENHYIELDGEKDLSDLKTTVYIQARRSDMEEIQSKDINSIIRAYVDVYEVDENTTNRLIIHYEIIDKSYARKIEFYDLKNKSYFEANVDDSTTKEIEVRYDIQGSPEDGYIYIRDDEDIQVTPEVITLTGPSSQIEDIAYGKVTIRVDDATANVSKKSNIVLYNTKDEVVSYSRDTILVSINEASVFVPVYAVKTVPIQAGLTGSVQEGYEYGKDIALSVTEMQIYGPESTINKVSSISLPKVDLSELTSSFQQTYDLAELLTDLYPQGDVRLYEESEKSTQLTFTVGKQESKTFEIDTSKITVYGNRTGWSSAFTGSTFKVEVVGLRDNIRNFDPDSLIMSVRLKDGDFTVGKHQVQVDISGLGSVSLKNSAVTVEMEMKQGS